MIEEKKQEEKKIDVKKINKKYKIALNISIR